MPMHGFRIGQIVRVVHIDHIDHIDHIKTTQVAQPAGGVPLRTETVWVRIPPRVREGAGA